MTDMSEKKICECGGKYALYNYSKHLKTDKHQKYITGNNSINKFAFFCKCGGRYMELNKQHHYKTKMHTDYMQSFFKNDEDYQNEYHLDPNDEKQYYYLINKKNINVKDYYKFKCLLDDKKEIKGLKM